MDKWYNSREGWIAYFHNHYDWLRPLVTFWSGSQAGNRLDKYRNVSVDSSDEELRILYGILQKAWEDAPEDKQVSYMTGWVELCNLCSEAYILWEKEKVDATS